MLNFTDVKKRQGAGLEWDLLPTIKKEPFWSDVILPHELVEGAIVSDTIRRHLLPPRLPRVWGFSTEIGGQFQWGEQRTVRALAKIGYTIELLRAISSEPFVYIRTITDLDDPRYELLQPIQVKVEISMEGVVCSCMYSERYGWGETCEEALARLKENIIVFYEALNNKEEKTLSKELRRQKRFLGRVIKEVNG